MAQKKSSKQGKKGPGASQAKTGSKKRGTRKSFKSDQFARFGSMFFIFLLGALFSITVLTAVLILQPESGSEAQKESATKPSLIEEQNQFREKVQGNNLVDPDQDSKPDLEQSLKQVDLALLQSLIQAEVEPARLQQIGLNAQYQEQKTAVPCQTLVLSLEKAEREKFLQAFQGYKRKWLRDVQVSGLTSDSGGFEIFVLGLPTHRLLFDDYSPETLPEPIQGRLALVVDDLGQSLLQARQLIETLGDSVTFSILPFQAKSKETAELAKDQGLDVLLHLPMEPEGYPEIDPGPGALFVSMQPHLIRRIVQENLEQVPGSIGVNNHMGSRFSADLQGMRVVLQELKQNRLFYMDSLTTSNSRVKSLAREISIPILSRDVFIDNKQDVQAILIQLRKAEQLALRVGQAIAVGHPYPETLHALEIWAEDRQEGIELVRISDLIWEN